MTTRRDLLNQALAAGASAMLSGRAAGRPRITGIGDHAHGSKFALTVSGPLDTSNLGFTLVHEHIADGPDFLKKWPPGWGGRAGLTARIVEKLKLTRSAGVSTIVDLTTYDVGRDIRFLEEVSRKSGIAMIAATGQRFFPPNAPPPMHAQGIQGLADFFVAEIDRGIDGTPIRAGVIKIGIVGKTATALEETGLRAAARASKATGVPIRIHTDAAHRAAENHAAILEDERVAPEKVSFDHSDDSGEMDYFLGLVRRGYSVSMDHVHRGLKRGVKPSFVRRAECIKLLIAAGFADKIFLSTDTELADSLLPPKDRSWRYQFDPGDGMLFVLRDLIPYLKSMQISSRDIRAMTVENPRKFFGVG